MNKQQPLSIIPHPMLYALKRNLLRFTLIELLMKYTCQPCNYMLYYRRECKMRRPEEDESSHLRTAKQWKG